MKILVLAKQVPDTTEMKIDKKTGTLIRTGVPTICNPDDLAAVEEALVLKEKLNAHVTVVTMGPLVAKDMLRELIAMGVDEAVLITDRAFAGSDTWATSNTISTALKGMEFDLIIGGRQAIDGDTAQVGPQVAERLGIPQVTYVCKVNELKDGWLSVDRAYEDVVETLEVKLPALITTLSDMNTPRYPNLARLWNLYDHDELIRVVTNETLGLTPQQTGLSGSPTLVKATFPREVSAINEVHTISPQEAAEGIAKLLQPYLEGGSN